MGKDEFFAVVTPALISFLAVVVPALFGWLTSIVNNWANKQNEAVDRSALHLALQSGASAATQKYGQDGYKSDKVAYAIDYAKHSVPQAIKNLSPPEGVLVKLAQAKVQTVEPCNEK